MTYTPIELPPQVPARAFVCGDCSAIVTDPDRHTESHVSRGYSADEPVPPTETAVPREPRRTSRVPNAELDAAAAKL